MKRMIAGVTVLAIALSTFPACAPQKPVVPYSSASEQSVSESFSADASSKPEPVPSQAPVSTLEVAVGGATASVTAGAELSTFDVSSVETLPAFSMPDAQCSVVWNGTSVFEGSAEALKDFRPSQNGVYTYKVALPDGSAYQFGVNCQFPVQITVPTTAQQGETVLIRADYADGITLTAQSGLDFTPQFFADGNAQTALLPIRYTTASGVYPLTIRAGELTFRYEIQVQKREFETQYLTMDPGTAADTALSAAANAEWEQKIEPLKKIADPQRYWENPFLQPVQGEITTEFGCIRYTNDDPNPTRHSGIDIATAKGTPVLACNNGRVLFADFLQLTGNTVIIEHGYGLKSFHYHMDSLNVKAGEMVKKGQQIGAVGTTGYSTGPHLHFGLAVNNVFVNPWTAFQNGI